MASTPKTTRRSTNRPKQKRQAVSVSKKGKLKREVAIRGLI